VLVGADGLIRSELAQGGPAIKELLSSCGRAPSENVSPSAASASGSLH
jgi:hypothetical protein